MCGRYYRRSDKQRIAEAFHLGMLDDIPLEAAPSYNIAPSTMQPVVRQSRDSGERGMVAMRWGMVPHFAKSLAEFKGFSTINAKAETLLSRAIGGFRFSVGDASFSLTAFTNGSRWTQRSKQPYAFAVRSGEPFAFGGLRDGWKSLATGDWLQSFSIITTAPNELTATVHDRMPVILKPSDYDRWLDRTDAERPPVDLLRPYEAAEMTAHEVDPRVGNVRNDEPSLCNIWQCPPNST